VVQQCQHAVPDQVDRGFVQRLLAHLKGGKLLIVFTSAGY
jgi:hypothetical protein